MRNILLILFLLAGCATTQPAFVCPACPPVIKPDTVLRVEVLYDTIIDRTMTRWVALPADTLLAAVKVYPSADGDSYTTIQGAVNYCIDYPGHYVQLMPGVYYLSHPIIVAKTVGSDYVQVTVKITGFQAAQNAVGLYATVIKPLYNDLFCVGIQQGKNCEVSNISFVGNFTFPNSLSTLDIYRTDIATWMAGNNRTEPNAAVVIEPFSDPNYYDGVNYKKYAGLEAWYLPGMARNGSTVINILNCEASNFEVGFMITPSMQQNGENVNMIDCRVDYCTSCVAFSQSQSKTCTIVRMLNWGAVNCVLDGAHWGFPHSDGATCPNVDGMNVAGDTYELICAGSNATPITIANVTAERLHKIGTAGGEAGTHFADCKLYFANSEPNLPSPDCYYNGSNTSFTNCALLRYTGSADRSRIVLNNPTNVFRDGSMSAPPLALPLTERFYYMNKFIPIFDNVSMMYYPEGAFLQRGDYDSAILIGPTVIHLNPVDYSGWFLKPKWATFNTVGDLVTMDGYLLHENAGTFTHAMPVGDVASFSGDTVRIVNVGIQIKDGDTVNLSRNVIKNIL